jgi:hypothetical protein
MNWLPIAAHIASAGAAHVMRPVLGLLEIVAGHVFPFILPDPGLLAGDRRKHPAARRGPS